MEPVTVFLISIGVYAVVRALTRPEDKDTADSDNTKAIKCTKATKDQIQHIQQIGEQARYEFRQATESYSAQARAVAQNQKRK